MKAKLLVSFLFLAIPFTAQAQNIGKCGWGSKVFEGQRGIAPQVLAATTNGTSGNQTFAITFGTSGCTQNGVVSSTWRTAMFIQSNMTKLAKDVSVGEGETLNALASIIGVESADESAFRTVLKSNYSKIFSSSEVTSNDVVLSMKSLLEGSTQLAKYSAVI